MNNKMTYSVRIVAGLYLIYTSYNLLKDVINGVSKNPVVFSAAGVIFLGFAIAFISTGIRGLRQSQEVQQKKEQEDTAEILKPLEENIDQIEETEE